MNLRKIKTYSFKVGLTVAVLLVPFLSNAADFPKRPNPPRLVNDLAGVFDKNQVETLERTLVKFNDQTSTQVAVVTLSDLKGYDAGDYSFRMAEDWGVGQKGKNNGILILEIGRASCRERV